MHRGFIFACAGLCVGLAAIAACSGSGGSDITTGDAGTGADGGGEGGSGPSPAQAAGDLAHVVCQRFEECAPAFITIGYGGAPECEKRFTAQFADNLSASGSNQTTSQVEACVAAAQGLSCADLLGRKTPDICKPPPGQLTDGKACATDAQCTNKRCKVAPGAACGTCTSPVAGGQACGKDDDCDDGLKCVNSACVPYGAMNAACDGSHPCNPTLACVGGTCGAPRASGACNAADECDQLHGVFCDGKQCQPLQFANAPAACGLVDGGLQLCNGPASCVSSGAGKGTCASAPADNAPCTADGGAACEGPSVCLNGACTFPASAACK